MKMSNLNGSFKKSSMKNFEASRPGSDGLTQIFLNSKLCGIKCPKM